LSFFLSRRPADWTRRVICSSDGENAQEAIAADQKDQEARGTTSAVRKNAAP
jgi:hypothetical protein